MINLFRRPPLHVEIGNSCLVFSRPLTDDESTLVRAVWATAYTQGQHGRNRLQKVTLEGDVLRFELLSLQESRSHSKH
jgi:hypothetical protein